MELNLSQSSIIYGSSLHEKDTVRNDIILIAKCTLILSHVIELALVANIFENFINYFFL